MWKTLHSSALSENVLHNSSRYLSDSIENWKIRENNNKKAIKRDVLFSQKRLAWALELLWERS